MIAFVLIVAFGIWGLYTLLSDSPETSGKDAGVREPFALFVGILIIAAMIAVSLAAPYVAQ